MRYRPGDAPAAEPPGQTTGGRNAGSVAAGVVLGFIAGVFGVLGMWLARLAGLLKGSKNDDMFFGAWLGVGVHVAVIGIILVAVTSAGSSASGSSTGTTTRSQSSGPSDSVIDKQWLCRPPAIGQAASPDAIDEYGVCSPKGYDTVRLTIRAVNGTHYQVDFKVTTAKDGGKGDPNVSIGDRWPLN